MKDDLRGVFHRLGSRHVHRLVAVPLLLIAAMFAGCGGGGGFGPVFSGNTTIDLLATSTANDQLVQFPLTLKNMTLTSLTGTTVTLFSTPVSAEFIHLNGSLEPLATVSVPQGIYTAASAVFDGTAPVCVGLDPSSGVILIDGALNGPGTPTVTVNLPQPIVVTGAGMGLVLNLQVSKSAPFSGGCVQDLSVPIAPVFNLTPLPAIATRPTNISNGKIVGLVGVVASTAVAGSQFTQFALSVPRGYWNGNPPTLQVSTNGGTVYQGIVNGGDLVTGMPVEMDAALQGDGTLMATRVAVYNTDATNLSLSLGQLLMAGSGQSTVDGLTAQMVGELASTDDEFGYGSASFGVSSQFTNLQNLPFAANFSATNQVAGQNVLITSNASLVNGFPPLPLPATTMTLMPQTIDGTVSAVSTSGGFNIYTVTLAAYNLFPNLASENPRPLTPLTNPNTVVVYADSNTQMLNTNPIAVGSVVRFYGLVFNDNGTLRMDCAEINDGVPE